MSYPIATIEGIGPANVRKLKIGGIKTTGKLLQLCCSRNGREAVSRETGISESRLLQWANMADLMRINGIGRQYSELLEAAGVDTVKELRNRRPATLATRMEQVNDERRLSRRTPTASMVESWVNQAKALLPVITH